MMNAFIFGVDIEIPKMIPKTILRWKFGADSKQPAIYSSPSLASVVFNSNVNLPPSFRYRFRSVGRSIGVAKRIIDIKKVALRLRRRSGG